MTRIIQPGRNAWREVSADSAGALVDAADYYRAFYLAAESARHYILMSGWQFDSGVPLLRGRDAIPGTEVRFLKSLSGLCERRPALSVYLLAWDFHLVFALEREWMQRVLFHWMTHERFHFRFNESPVSGGSHHQKFVVISELHASWEVSPDTRQERPLARAIRRLRVSLLAEHGGFSGPTVRRLVAIDGVVRRLNELTTHPGARLQQHGPPTPAQAVALQIVDPQALPFDPDTSNAEQPGEPGRANR